MKSHKPKQKEIGNYRVDKVLGKGTYGTVRLGIHKETGSKVTKTVPLPPSLQKKTYKYIVSEKIQTLSKF
jgi:serine/threonine protein kinase